MATYPPVYAGTTAEAALLEAMLYDEVAKAATESLTASTTYQDDDELFLPAVANATYRFDLLLLHSSSNAGRFKMQFTAPAGSTVAASRRFVSLRR